MELNRRNPKIPYSVRWTNLSMGISVFISGIDFGGIDDNEKIKIM